MTPTMEELAIQVDEAQWEWLKAHLERDGLVIVSQELELAEVGQKVAADDAAPIRSWIEAGKLSKPTAGQITQWNAEEGKRFKLLIVSPYILIQETPSCIQ